MGLADCIRASLIIFVRSAVAISGLAKPYTDIPHEVRDTIGTAIYFTVYESGKQLSVKFQGSDSPTSPLSVAVAGGLCGLVSWACVSFPDNQVKWWPWLNQ